MLPTLALCAGLGSVPLGPQAPQALGGDLGRDQPPMAEPRVLESSGEGEAALAAFEVAAGFAVELWAEEPLVANPVALGFDARGGLYVCETFRHHAGVTDVREHLDWLDDDLRARTTADRLAFLRRRLGDAFGEFCTATERVRFLADADGDGRAERSTVFADHFNDPLDGIAAGILARGGEAWYTCIPNLWRLADRDGDGAAEERRALSSGWGVHVGYLGHDLHAPVIGPDGRLYFSIGDRGFDVATPAGRVALPDTGAVLRCDLDGGGLEIVHSGLRNPQDLAFDDWGNLFTADNNSDGGDRARLVQVLWAADSGWRYPYQWKNDRSPRGPWNDERLWQPHWSGQAAYLLPPIANFADGPSGFAAAPGTGFPGGSAGAFYLCDFRGARASSGIHALRFEPAGAGFALGEHSRFVWGVLATDCDFAPDGALYFCDWVDGWNQTGKGRVYRAAALDRPGPTGEALARDTAAELAAGFEGRPIDELALLLAHADRRVRQEAHLELAARGDAAREVLERAARAGPEDRARLHAVWALGIQGRTSARARSALAGLLSSAEPHVAEQAAKALGDLGDAAAVIGIAPLVEHGAPAEQREAAIALGRIGARGRASCGAEAARMVLESLFRCAERAQDSAGPDPALRHAACFGLAGWAEPEELLAARSSPSVARRLAAVVALRRAAHPGVAEFLGDADSQVRAEAARAIHDVPIEAARPALAALLGSSSPRAPDGIADPVLADEMLARRALGSAFALGTSAAAELLGAAALRPEHSEELRAEALELLARWETPEGPDPVTGSWLFLDSRARESLETVAARLEAGGPRGWPPRVARAWLSFAAPLGRAAAPALALEWAADPSADPALRVDAVELLAAGQSHGAETALAAAQRASDPAVRAAALEALLELAPARALPGLEAALASGDARERAAAYAGLARVPSAEARALLARELDLLERGLAPAETALELVSAARASGDPALAERAARREAERSAADPRLGPWLDALAGGDPERGAELVRAGTKVECLRCHKVGEADPSEIGPDLRGLAERATRISILESLVDPNRAVAPGFERRVVFRTDGTSLVGTLESETDAELVLRTQEGARVAISRAEIELTRPDLSAMPENAVANLDAAELRDLVAYLASL